MVILGVHVRGTERAPHDHSGCSEKKHCRTDRRRARRGASHEDHQTRGRKQRWTRDERKHDHGDATFQRMRQQRRLQERCEQKSAREERRREPERHGARKRQGRGPFMSTASERSPAPWWSRGHTASVKPKLVQCMEGHQRPESYTEDATPDLDPACDEQSAKEPGQEAQETVSHRARTKVLKRPAARSAARSRQGAAHGGAVK